MASKFTVSHGTGWLMAGPAVLLIAGFVILPFFLAFAFSFTNKTKHQVFYSDIIMSQS